MNDTRKKNLIKSSVIVSFFVCLGKIFGFLKQTVIAWAFGASAGTDIYFAADSYIAMIGQIQISSIAPSVLTEYIYLNEAKKTEELKALLRKCFFIFPLIAVLLIIINVVMADCISCFMGISYSLEQRYELKKFIIYLCPVILFTAFSGVSTGILDANSKFIPSKLLSLFFSIAIILFVLLYKNKMGINSMLIGFLVGYGVHTFFITILAKKYFTFGKIIKNDLSFRRVINNIFPLVLGNSIIDVGHLIDKIIASSLTTGSVSYLYYGQVISNDLINAVIITSIGTVLLPSLTKMAANKCDGSEIAARITSILNIIITLLIGIICLYIVEGSDLIKLFFERGKFSSNSTDFVTKIALCYVVGFCFIAVREVLTKIYYAYQDTKTPMKNGVIGVVINIILSLILSRYIGVAGIALATSISIAIVACLMCITIKKHISVFPLQKVFLVSLFKSLFAGIIIVFLGITVTKFFNFSHFVIRMIIVSLFMIVLYGLTLLVMRHEMFFEIKRMIQKNHDS